jgi:hypothetical protein
VEHVAASPGEHPVLEVVRVYKAVVYVAGRLSSILARHDGKPCNARRGSSSRGHTQRLPWSLQASSQPALLRSGCGWDNATCLQQGSPPRVTCPPAHRGSSTCPRCQSLSLLRAKTLVSYDDQQLCGALCIQHPPSCAGGINLVWRQARATPHTTNRHAPSIVFPCASTARGNPEPPALSIGPAQKQQAAGNAGGTSECDDFEHAWGQGILPGPGCTRLRKSLANSTLSVPQGSHVTARHL